MFAQISSIIIFLILLIFIIFEIAERHLVALIGASANVVGLSIANKARYSIRWRIYLKTMLPAVIIVIFISMISLFILYFNL